MTPVHRAKRIPHSSRALVEGLERPLLGATLNVSTSGVALRFRYSKRDETLIDSVKSGQEISVGFRLGTGTDVMLRGLIMWSNDSARDISQARVKDVGVRFFPDQTQLEPLKHFVATFEYRVVLFDVSNSAAVQQALSEDYSVTVVDNEDGVRGHISLGNVGLVVVGEGPNPIEGERRVRRILEGSVVEHTPPILLLTTVPLDSVTQLTKIRSEVVAHPADLSMTTLRILARRCMENFALTTENERLAIELEATTERLSRENARFRSQLSSPIHLEGMIGESDQMKKVYETVDRIAKLDTSVFIHGESGTGKGMIAQAIHRRSRRSARPFVTQNCAALTESLLDSELFGHAKGAFTGAVADRAGIFEAAEGGTVFLDEVAEMSPAMQAKLLNVLQDNVIRRVGSVDPVRINVRVICASHQALDSLVKRGKFREDLYYRLVSFVIRLPPLRERTGDIRPLVHFFIAQFCEKNGIEPRPFSEAVLMALEQQPWLGNVRQLQHTVERLLVMRPDGGDVDLHLFDDAIRGDREGFSLAAAVATAPSGAQRSLDDDLSSREKQLVLNALERTGWVIADAARELGVNRTTLSKRIKRLGLERP